MIRWYKNIGIGTLALLEPMSIALSLREAIMKRYYVLSFVALVFLAGCGGGGDCTNSVACVQPDPNSLVESSALVGVYDVEYSLSASSCLGAALLPKLREEYSASLGVGYHGAPTIEVSSSNGITYLTYSTVDNTDGRTFFHAVEDFEGRHDLPNFVSGMTCSETIFLSIYNIDKAPLSVTRTSDITCTRKSDDSSVSCQVVYNGSGAFTRTDK